LHGSAFFVRLGLVVRWGFKLCPQYGVSGGAEVVQKSLGGCQLRLGQFVDESM
jgi:hypothetical protein